MIQEIKDVGIPEIFREECQLTGTDSNIFGLLGVVKNHLKEQGRQWEKDDKIVDLQEEPRKYFNRKSEEMMERVKDSGGYDQALGIILEYVVAM